MVDFFNANDFPVTISWDGYHTKETRLFDVFSHPKLKERILRLKWLGLSGVISSRAYPMELLTAFQNISDEYEKIHGYKVRINLDAIFDTGITEKSLLDVDYDRVAREMHEMATLYLKASLSGVQEARDLHETCVYRTVLSTASRFLHHEKRSVESLYCPLR